MMKDFNINNPQLKKKKKMYSQINFGEAPLKPVTQVVSVGAQRALVCS